MLLSLQMQRASVTNDGPPGNLHRLGINKVMLKDWLFSRAIVVGCPPETASTLTLNASQLRTVLESKHGGVDQERTHV